MKGAKPQWKFAYHHSAQRALLGWWFPTARDQRNIYRFFRQYSYSKEPSKRQKKRKEKRKESTSGAIHKTDPGASSSSRIFRLERLICESPATDWECWKEKSDSEISKKWGNGEPKSQILQAQFSSTSTFVGFKSRCKIIGWRPSAFTTGRIHCFERTLEPSHSGSHVDCKLKLLWHGQRNIGVVDNSISEIEKKGGQTKKTAWNNVQVSSWQKLGDNGPVVFPVMRF